MKITTDIQIEASPGKIWFWLGDPERAREWQTGVGRTKILHKTADWVGTTFKETIVENDTSTEMEGVVTGYEENRYLSMSIEGQYNRVVIAWELEPTGDSTVLRVDADVTFKGKLRPASLVFRPVFRKNILNQLDYEIAELKGLCEESS